MSKSQKYNKKHSVIDAEYEDGRPAKRKVERDKRKERRIERALKTKNVQDIFQYDESIDLDPLAKWGEEDDWK